LKSGRFFRSAAAAGVQALFVSVVFNAELRWESINGKSCLRTATSPEKKFETRMSEEPKKVFRLERRAAFLSNYYR